MKLQQKDPLQALPKLHSKPQIYIWWWYIVLTGMGWDTLVYSLDWDSIPVGYAVGTFGKVREQEALGEFAFKEVEYWAHVQNTYFVEQEAFSPTSHN